MKKLLFETSLGGHRLEYIHHIYMGMIKYSDDELIIVVPEDYEIKKNLYQWPKANNIRFYYIKETDKSKKGILKESYANCRLLRRYIKVVKPDMLILISLISYIPFLPFIIPRKTKVSGIIYSIYLYIWNNSSWKRRMMDVAKYLILSKHRCFDSIFILNDAPSARRLNHIYHTNKFHYLTDPFNSTNYNPHNIRAEQNIPQNNKIFLQFGGLTKRKGTLTILEAIKRIPSAYWNQLTFVFAGKIYSDLHDSFYQDIDELKSKIQVLVFDQYCSNELIADLCYTSDFILIPYENTSQSSGVLGHAANYQTPVIGPSEGLLGKLIKRNKLGITLSDISPHSLAKIILEAKPFKVYSQYKEMITIEEFQKELFKWS